MSIDQNQMTSLIRRHILMRSAAVTGLGRVGVTRRGGMYRLVRNGERRLNYRAKVTTYHDNMPPAVTNDEIATTYVGRSHAS